MTEHHCSSQKLLQSAEQQQQPLIQRQPSNSNNNNLSKEIAAIKAQLLVLASRLERIEQEIDH
jgi:hypothetical protein